MSNWLDYPKFRYQKMLLCRQHFLIRYFSCFAMDLPASWPVAHEDCKLNPPVTPSMFMTSPAKNRRAVMSDSMV